MPERFTAESDDRLMNSLISKYALEGNTLGKANGQFFLDKAGALAVGREVVKDHMNFRGAKLDAYLNSHFPELWDHMDVNGDGIIEVSRGTILLRSLIDSQQIGIALQVQTGEDMEAVKHQKKHHHKSHKHSLAQADPVKEVSILDSKFKPHMNGFDGYERVIPERFSEESDDRLMNSLIGKYSIEGETNGKPNGQFVLDRKAVQAVSEEVAGTHLKLTGAKNAAYVNERLAELWPKFDVNGVGYIEAARAAVLLRELVGNVYDAFGLQMQVGAHAHKK
jgi:hypothetical protein